MSKSRNAQAVFITRVTNIWGKKNRRTFAL